MFTWDDATDKKFLLSIIHAHGLDKINWTAVLVTMGDEYTLESVRTRFKRLKQQAKAQSGDTPTPASSKVKAIKGEKSTGTKRKQKKTAATKEDSYGDDDKEQTPSKKVKMEVKEEAADDESEGEMV